ncbi:hypothetical protein GCM10023340_36320 [Nocardioides marinquilinus]|uniref:DUF732 domain-containing protein n=1 Tax=Nocardioides marinquilinus TaxID=1210400 RepID=A0ABP9PXC4_9ACTN
MVALFLLAAVSACGGEAEGGGGVEQSGRADVPWGSYADGLQGRIDQLEANGRCNALQREFDVADRNNKATLDRTGEHNNAELLKYIDEALGAAGCYD